MEDPQKDQNTSEITPELPAAPAETEEQQRANFFVKDLDAKFDAEGISMAFLIIADPKLAQPIVYTRGQTYAVARMLAQMARHFRDQIIKELTV